MATESPIASGPEYYEGQDLEALADLPHYYRWILKTFGPYLRGTVLEVGAGIGNFSAHYVHGVERAVLLEPARNLYLHLADRFAGAGHVRPVCGLLEDWSAERERVGPADLFDATVLVNVLEHVPDDRGMIARLRDLLRPGGTLLVFVPALKWLYGTLDEVVHHYRRYSFSGLARLVRQAGLELVHLRYFDVLGVLPWLVTGRVLKQRRFNPAAARIYDRAVVPVASRLERLLPLPLGKNLICVARRPG
jgi:SAM-dependent methyltransferase